MLTSEESSYGIHWLLLANSRTQGACGTTRFEKDATSWAISMLPPSLTWAMLLFCWLYWWILVPRPIIRSQSWNDTNVNLHVGFSLWGETVYCSRSVYRRACLQYYRWIVASAYLPCRYIYLYSTHIDRNGYWNFIWSYRYWYRVMGVCPEFSSCDVSVL